MLRLVQTPYGPLVRGANLINATTEQPHVSVEFINIWALLAHIITKGGGFAEFIRERHTASPSSARKPWTCSCFVRCVVVKTIMTYIKFVAESA